MGGGSGVTSDELTAKASDVLKGKLYMGLDTDDEAGTGTIPTYAGRTITPGTANQTIAAGQYLGGNVIIAGDADLKAANIKSGVNIFGVAGSCKEYKQLIEGYMNFIGNLSFKVRIGSLTASLVSRTLPCVRYTGHGFMPYILCYKQGLAWEYGIGMMSKGTNAIEMNIENGYYYNFPLSDNPNIIINSNTIQLPIYNGDSTWDYAYLCAAGY